MRSRHTDAPHPPQTDADLDPWCSQLRLQMMGDTFILNMMEGIYPPAIENIDICAASADVADVHSVGPASRFRITRY